MNNAVAKAIFLQDYQACAYLIDETHLKFQLAEVATQVSARLVMRRNPAVPAAPLVLNGVGLETRQIAVDGKNLTALDYQIADNRLTINLALPERFELETLVSIKPQLNTELEGLYKSRSMFCTQCEAEGFRRITWYLDRPDVMSVFTVTILAEQQRYPVLLSNGNLVESGKLSNGMHWATWKDPHKKPAYLFALVAGNLRFVEDFFTTASGRRVALRIYVEEKDLSKCAHAMDSLKRAMSWDEKVYGREYDLDIFMIVAVDDFNMGAMENKGLNIFNTSCVLARSDITTDRGFQRVEGVVAHEYFHNWSGNRVTCRDWFQLSLKEGFTVFRDSQFSADMGSATVKRVEDVNLLRTVQFAEDASPMAHPVQPPSYMEISNFYTPTIYEKGAEVVGMLHTLLGAELFRQGSDLYFSRHDGQAVTIEEFVGAMETVSGRDLGQFRRWYTQAGTPVLQVRGEYDAAAQRYHLHVAQSCPPTPEAEHKQPFLIPLKMALLGEAGSLALQLEGEPSAVDAADNTERVLEISAAEQTFVFVNVKEEPVPSLLRGFSAPVKLQFPYSREQLAFLMSRDSDGFNRWEAAQQLGVAVLQDVLQQQAQRQVLAMDSRLVAAYRALLQDKSLDPAMVALMLELPGESYLADLLDAADPLAIHRAREFCREKLARELKRELLEAYHHNQQAGTYNPGAEEIARRSLKNTALSYLMLLADKELTKLCLEQYNSATNMTDTSAALAAIINCEADFIVDVREKALRLFYRRWQQESLAINHWLQLQAVCPRAGALERVQALLTHEAFDSKNPNKVRAVIGAFAQANLVSFHAEDGSGYRFLADQVISLDKLNPQIAARLVMPLIRYKKLLPVYQQRMREELQRILLSGTLSPDLFEVVSKALK